MKKAVIALALATAVFATSTAYLAYELHRRISRDAATAIVESSPVSADRIITADRPPTSGATVEPAGSAAARPAASTSTVPNTTGDSARPTSTPSRDTLRDSMLPHARQFLARFDDANQHAALIEETKTSLRRQYEPLKNRLELDDASFEQLLSVMAEQTLQPQEKYYRCLADPNCDLSNFGRGGNIVDDRSAELMALLGPDNMDDFTQYQTSLGEREAVIQLRGRLSDANNLRDSQAEQLVAALSDERARYQREAMQRGTSVSGWGTGQLGMLFYPGDSNSIDERLANAAQYSRRLHDRAATVLSPQQLAVFDQMQKELLAAMKATMSPAG